MPADPAPHTRGRDSEPGIVELCETHARMPVDIARWTSAGLPDHVTPDDLAPAAWEGLYDAAATWRPDLGPFKPWARVKIRAAIIADLRAADPQPKSWRARQNAIDRARHDLTGRLGRHPIRDEVARALGLTTADFDRHRRGLVLVAPLADNADIWVRDPTPTADEQAGQHADLDGWVRAAVLALPARRRDIIHGLYWRGQTAAAIAAPLGVTASRVSQIHAESVAMIRDALAWHLDQQPGPALSARSARRRDDYRHAVAHAHDLHRD